MIRETVNALAACVVTFVLCAVAYPAAVWGLGQLAFPRQAEGSLIDGRDRTVIGSELIAQPFASDEVLLPPALGRRLQGRRDRRLEPGDQEPRPPQEGRRAGRGAEGDRREPGAGRPGDGLGRRARPAHQPRGGALPGGPGGRGAASCRSTGSAT